MVLNTHAHSNTCQFSFNTVVITSVMKIETARHYFAERGLTLGRVLAAVVVTTMLLLLRLLLQLPPPSTSPPPL